MLVEELRDWAFCPTGETVAEITHIGNDFRKCKSGRGLKSLVREQMRSLGIPLSDEHFGFKVIAFRGTRQRSDIDNIQKVIADAGTGVLWKDDSQIVEQYGRIFLEDSSPRVLLYIYRVARTAREINRLECTCERCGGKFQRAEGQRPPRYCSRACRYPRVRRQCAVCGKGYECAPSLIKYGYVRACSIACARTFHTRKAASSRQRNLCTRCGGPVSKRKYRLCRPCHIGGLATTTSLYKAVTA